MTSTDDIYRVNLQIASIGTINKLNLQRVCIDLYRFCKCNLNIPFLNVIYRIYKLYLDTIYRFNPYITFTDYILDIIEFAQYHMVQHVVSAHTQLYFKYYINLSIIQILWNYVQMRSIDPICKFYLQIAFIDVVYKSHL